MTMLATILAATTSLAAPQADCLAVRRAKLEKAAVVQAELVPAAAFTAPDGTHFDDLPAFCRVVIRATPSPVSNVMIEVWLPEKTGWNSKFLGTGNGGFGGRIDYAALSGGLARGYAVVNTDMGTFPAGLARVDYDAGNGRPEIVKDWAYRATHAMTLAGKAIAERYYGVAAQRAYFVGCSTGGHQGLTEAQRYPEDYDGIIAGAAGNNRTHLHAAFTQMFKVASAPDALLSAEKLALFRAFTLRNCGGKDGGSDRDEFLTDPLACGVRPADLACKAGDAKDCLTSAEVQALTTHFDGVRNPRNKALIYYALTLGSEHMLSYFQPNALRQSVPAHLSRWVFGADWDAGSFDFDRDMRRVDRELGPIVNALDPDLSAFAGRGGKLLLYHGWQDAVVSPLDSISYFQRTTAATRSSGFATLFMVPGMDHCSGGEGLAFFGQRPNFRSDVSPTTDAIAALDHWVTTGKAPQTLIARKFKGGSEEGQPVAARPLCPFPFVARLRPGADPAAPESFTCSPGELPSFEPPAPDYLR